MGMEMKKATGLRKVPRMRSARKLDSCAMRMRVESASLCQVMKTPDMAASMSMPEADWNAE